MTDKKNNQKTEKATQKDLNTNEMIASIKEKKQKILDLKIDLKLGKLKNPHEINILRKDIAKLKTKLNLNKFIQK